MEEIQELLDDICETRYTENWNKLNFKLIPTTVINATVGSESKFNKLYHLLLKSDYTTIKRTKSGGISTKKSIRLYNHYVYDIQQYKNVVEITICKPVNYVMRAYRIQYRNNNYKEEKDEHLITGWQSYNIFKRELKKDGINLEDYAISKEEGIEVNKEITKPDIRLMNNLWERRIFFDACHLDFHKFYMSGLMLSHPEMAKTIKRIAEWSKNDNKYKTVLAATIGYFHSPACSYRYAKLAKDAINKAYENFYKVFNELNKDRLIIATNTDGIWYKGSEWNGILESPELGGWSNDHTHCTLRFKSAGSYEFVENDVYYPVVRGRTKLDTIKDRSEWKWGDIFQFNACPEVYTFKKGVGIVWQRLM